MIKRLRESKMLTDVSNNESIEENSPSDSQEPRDEKNSDFASVVLDGVEVVDVKAIPKDKGIPEKGPRKTWDKPI